MFRVYISGPITALNEHGGNNYASEHKNVQRAAGVAYWCASQGMAVYWPHGTWYMDQWAIAEGKEPLGYKFMEQDYAWILQCNAVFRMQGQSKGGDLEVEFAWKHNIPVFFERVMYSNCYNLRTGKEELLNYKQECDEKVDVNMKVDFCKGPTAFDINIEGDSEFTKILHELQSLHDRKSKDYATDEDPLANLRGSMDYGIEPWIGTQFRLDDKRSRIKTAIRSALKGQQIKMSNESLEDSLIDRCVYSVIALQLYREYLKSHGDESDAAHTTAN